MSRRIKIFEILVILVALAIVCRLFYWQFINRIGARGEQSAVENIIPATRGEIYTSDNFPLAANQEAFIVYGKPSELKEDPAVVAKNIAPLLISEKYATEEAKLSESEEKTKEDEIKKEEEDLKNKLSNHNLIWVQLARKIPLSTKQKIENLKLPGLGFESDEKRFYPEASMAAHILGFVGSDKYGQDTGYNGLEGYWDKELKGKDGRLGQETDPLGIPILVGSYKPVAPQKGSSIYLTLDRTIQFFAEEKLRVAVEKYGAKQGTVIVADPKTGGILALANYPTYNPSIFGEYAQNAFKNPAIGDVYEPGSTFKLITMSAAIDLSKVTAGTKCDVCDGPRSIGGYKISTWDNKYHPNLTMTEVIQHSDNVGMTYVADKLGADKFYDYIGKFGFGQATGIDLQSEVEGNIRPREDWKPIDLATASFGQGLAVTPIQVVQAVNVIANNGKLVSPHLVDKIKNERGEEMIKPKEERQIISPKTSAVITEMMVNAVEKGEAKYFAPKGYRIAGKTGTAQIPVAGHYDPDKTIASFVGFAPAENPRFVMLVSFTEPSSSIFGAETAAPTFFAIAKDIFNYFGITPDK